MTDLTSPILFYDAECGLCDRGVRWSMARDRRGVLRFAPLRGSTFAALDLPGKPMGLDTVVLYDRGELLTRSAAVLRVWRHVGGGWGVLARALQLVPTPVRDACYRFIAHRRLRWFGGPGACRLPTTGEGERLLP